MAPVKTILYRKGLNSPAEDKAEIGAALMAGFKVVHQRTDLEPGDVVIGRYSVIPHYKELEVDIENLGAVLVNTYRQHQFIADMREWCSVLGDLTPKLYQRLQDLPINGPFVLKGQTNSKKFLWNTHMYAANRYEAGNVWSRLRDDMFLADQEIYARDYVPLVQIADGPNGLPITKEFRFFVLNGHLICGGFYWANYVDDLAVVPHISEVPTDLLKTCINKIGDLANFYSIDVAQTEAGVWIVVEVNDGQMSGLSCIEPDSFYQSLIRFPIFDY